ncbi:CHAT domain-containing protein [Nocardia arizonensis]|uniref:CHAT domain-containing protein n=1 Tax=Nocardia arizonensis TaxID=1141647 RepID=UPI0006D039C5|nr:CHAT domain-containing tetratricopeptide repeat protein [Nocardia arizonensis]
MAERDRELADRLLAVNSVAEISSVLFGTGESIDVFARIAEADGDAETLVAELNARADALEAEERPRVKEAALVRFFARQVEQWRAEHKFTLQGPNPIESNPAAEDPQAQEVDSRERLEQTAEDLMALGDLDGAIAAYREADELVPALLDASFIHGVRRYRLAAALRSAGRLSDALDVLDRLDFHPSRFGMASDLPSLHRQAVDIHILRGYVLEDMGDYELGRLSYRAALDAADPTDNEDQVFVALTNIAVSFAKADRNREAVSEARRVLDYARTRIDKGFVPAALNNLGRMYLANGNPGAAMSSFRHALAIVDRPDAGAFHKVLSWIGIGDAAEASSDDPVTVDAYARALESADATGREEKACVTMLLGRLAPTLAGAGHLRERVWRLAESWSATGDDPLLTLAYGAARADMHAHCGRQAEAVQDERELLRFVKERRMGPIQVLRQTCALADRLIASPQPGTLQEAFDLLWRARGDLDADEVGSRIAGGSAGRRLHEQLVGLLVDHGERLRLPDHRGAAELAFDMHEEAKARDYLRHLASSWLPAPDRTPADLVRAEAELLAECAERGDTSARTGPRSRLERELAQVWEALRPHAPEYTRIRLGAPGRFADLRRHLRESPDRDECAFVSYFCGTHATWVFTYIPQTDKLAVSRTRVTRTQLIEAAQRLRVTFNGDPRAFPPTPPLHPRRPWRRTLSFLFELAPSLLPFLPQVADKPLLCVAADGPLHTLPLHTLPLPDGAPLARRHAIVQVLSASTVLHARVRYSQRPNHPPAQDSQPVVFCAGVAAHEDTTPALLENDADLLRTAGWQVTSVAGIAATRQHVLDALRQQQIAHLTCHGHFDAVEPLNSGLLLANGVERPSKRPSRTSLLIRREHLLTARELAALHIDVDLLTLRACSTGLRDDDAGGHPEGLTQALVCAGVRTVLVSLWNVDQASSRTLLAEFYRNRLAKPSEPLWRSLWSAQHKLMDSTGSRWEAHPYHWAPFALVGDWRRR